ncbi:hypothetical protein E2562_013454 [Oryza meyeriana var. granulata]|uniref:Uncharacterized protein n=1 Tax=Oryza meyeriana var. granulata TaxID=110450 RepID=A0A6G1BVB6_9ORYZ|nr:hypothetical protein E2562_013454 [Oryza meyeriana var. granulata]
MSRPMRDIAKQCAGNRSIIHHILRRCLPAPRPITNGASRVASRAVAARVTDWLVQAGGKPTPMPQSPAAGRDAAQCPSEPSVTASHLLVQSSSLRSLPIGWLLTIDKFGSFEDLSGQATRKGRGKETR